ncbi:MAG: hypothetical protein JXR05_05740 [Flavobacteriaceae bacterium]
MKLFKNLLLVFVLTFSTFSSAQEIKGILFPRSNQERNQRCNSFMQVYRQMPKEVRISVKQEGNKLFLETNDKQWFDRVFKSTGDGIAIDIVSKSRYTCDGNVEKTPIRGELLNAVYAQKLRRGLKKTGGNRYRVSVGVVPESMKGQELEFNILLLSNKTFCQYNTSFNLESYPWELLDMGIYLDSLTYKDKKIVSKKEGYVTKYKTLKFTIPFEKNKSEYSPADIKPVYDSLRLTDFNIKKININAYSSVEGSLERNIKLQEQRASSIALSLQSFQKPNIKTEVTSSENWVEFLDDIEKTDFSNFKSLSKEQIKQKLTGDVAKKLEPYLKHHRKAIITLELDKIDKYKDKSLDELVSLFNKSISEDNLDKAKVIQNSIFDKVKVLASPDALKGMNIPKQKKYVTLLTKNSMLKYLISVSYTLIVKNELKQLAKLDPKNKRIEYNLAVLELVLWRNNASKIGEKELKLQIISLKKLGVAQNLIDRMLVNFHIVKAQKNMRARQYEAKDESVEFILEMYENFSMANYDYLSLAQFLTYYSNIYDAIDLLEEKVQDLTIDEDLLFYYLNLTLVKKEITKQDAYRRTMLNAINLNKDRFCKLFNASNKKGITFQLLEDDYLRKTYCENCSN